MPSSEIIALLVSGDQVHDDHRLLALFLVFALLMHTHAQSRVCEKRGAKRDDDDIREDTKHVEQAPIPGHPRKQGTNGRQGKLYNVSDHSSPAQSTYQGRETDRQDIRAAENVGSVQ